MPVPDISIGRSFREFLTLKNVSGTQKISNRSGPNISVLVPITEPPGLLYCCNHQEYISDTAQQSACMVHLLHLLMFSWIFILRREFKINCIIQSRSALKHFYENLPEPSNATKTTLLS